MPTLKMDNILDCLGISRYRRSSIIIPLNVTKHIEHIYLFIYKNAIGYHKLIDLSFAFGITIFYDLITEHKVTSFFQILRLMKCMKNSLRAYVEAGKEKEPLITLSNFKYILREFNRKNLTKEQQYEFMDFFIENHKSIVGDKIVIGSVEFEQIFNKWILNKVKVCSV